MPKLTIERLGNISPEYADKFNADTLVLCVDGVLVENQISTVYKCTGPDSIPEFTVKFAVFCAEKTNWETPMLKLLPVQLN